MINVDTNKHLSDLYLRMAQQCLALAQLYEEKGFENLSNQNRIAAEEFMNKHEYYQMKDKESNYSYE